MDEADFSEDTTYREQEDLPYDGDFSQVKVCGAHDLPSTNGTLAVSEEVVLFEKGPKEKAACCEVYGNTAVAVTWDKIAENAVTNRHNRDKRCALVSCVPANEGNDSKSRTSDILLHHLSREQLLRGQGTGCDTLPETSNADSLDDAAILTDVISRYAKTYCPKEHTPAFADGPSPKSGVENNNKPSRSPDTAGGRTSPLGKPVAAGQSNHQDPSFLNRPKGPGDKHKNCQGQTPQSQLTEKASSGGWFKYSQGQVHYQLPDFSKVSPKAKIPRDTMEPATHTRQEALTGAESEKRHWKLTPTTQKEPPPNSYIFQKISQGKQMCQKLKEQTDLLKTKMTKEHAGCLPGPRSSRRSEVTGLPRAGTQEVTSKELRELAPKIIISLAGFCPERTCFLNHIPALQGMDHMVHSEPSHEAGSDPGPSCRPDSDAGLQYNKGEDSGSKNRNPQRVRKEEPPKGETDLGTPEQRVNSGPFQDARDSSTGKHTKIYLTCNADPATPSSHLRFLMIPGIQSLRDGNNMEETESKTAHSLLPNTGRATGSLGVLHDDTKSQENGHIILGNTTSRTSAESRTATSEAGSHPSCIPKAKATLSPHMLMFNSKGAQLKTNV
ncbi:hypothetical protein ACRRTK_022790 [Alexandromys fortis]